MTKKPIRKRTSAYATEYIPPHGMIALRVRRIVEETVLVTEEEMQMLDNLYQGPFASEEEAQATPQIKHKEIIESWERECALADRNYFNGTFDDAENKKTGYGDIHYPGILEVLRPDDTKLVQR